MRVAECGDEAWTESASRWTRIGSEPSPNKGAGVIPRSAATKVERVNPAAVR